MTRDQLAVALGGLLDHYAIPVSTTPHRPVVAPAVIVTTGAPYRSPTQTLCFTKTWELHCVAARMDDADPDGAADRLADLLCQAVTLDGIVNEGAGPAPGVETIGDVDYLTFRFVLTDYNLGSAPEEC